MIVINFNKPEFEYDVHSMVKAYLPKEDVEMYYTCPLEEVEGKNVACTHREIEKEDEETRKRLEEAEYIFYVDYLENKIALKWIVNGDMYFTRDFEVDFSDRKETKNALKQNLYDVLKEGTGRELPWGTLTGIRPTKIPMKLMEEGKSDEEIFQYMKETYFATDEKIQLSIDIAKRERKLLEKIDYENGYSLYIGIPFCPSTCLYCSFTSYPLGMWKNRVDEYLDALEKEITFTATKFYHKKLNSIYIGGGTPTTLSAKQLDRLIRKIKCSFDLQHCVEFTVEAGRPDSITKEKLEVLKKNGIVDRISINPQTMKQATLDLIGRHHTVEQIKESFAMAREVGFDNINMDLIMGLPEENLEDVRNTMEELKAMDPDNITIHSLAIKRAARLNMFKDDYKDMQMVNTQEHMDLCADYCKEMGLEPYYLYRQKGMAGNMENVGYAKKDKAGVYNILIMEEKQTIMALGAGATTKFVLPEKNPDGSQRIERVENVKDVKNYLERVDEMIERKIRKMEEVKWH
ncbi:MAG: coproporphyrinogen dehydrogenase HemZ [Agathobacter sp.]|nr:coproporphyrinogen dehydrogenase HemZ [Agathobacter sp.]